MEHMMKLPEVRDRFLASGVAVADVGPDDLVERKGLLFLVGTINKGLFGLETGCVGGS